MSDNIDLKKILEQHENVLIKINGNYWYLKRYYDDGEIIFEEFSKLLNIENAHYEIVDLDGKTAIASLSFRHNDKKFISGKEIINNFLKSLDENDEYYQMVNDQLDNPCNTDFRIEYFFNNLESIWLSLAYYFKNNPDKDQIIYNLVSGIKKRFFYRNFLLYDADFHFENWEIQILPEIKLAPNFDNSECLKSDIYGLSFGLTPESVMASRREQLEQFLKMSSDKDIEEFVNLFKIATPELFQKALTNASARLKREVTKSDALFNRYKDNYDFIKETLEEYRGKNGR